MNLVNPVIKDPIDRVIQSAPAFRSVGQLRVARGILTASLPARIGELVEIHDSTGECTLSEVIGFANDQVNLMPFASNVRLMRGDKVIGLGRSMRVPVGTSMLGRVIDAVGTPVDELGPLNNVCYRNLITAAPDALSRRPVTEVFSTGQRAIDGLLTMGRGQRVGLFAGSGVGKSTLLGQIARNAAADINIVALIGERGREVLPFLKESLGEQGLKKSVVIVSTANEPSIARVRAAETAVSIAHWFRQQGKNVFLMLDSITRFAMAQRDLGLLLGEPPTSRGYTPSVFQKLGTILEQLGNSDRGSVTALLTVLVDGDDMNDPISDAVRSIVDGHIVLDRGLANAGHFPAIDILQSASRLFHDLAVPSQVKAATAVRQSIATYRDVIDLVQVGAYKKGITPRTDLALERYPEVCNFLQQDLDCASDLHDTLEHLRQLALRVVPTTPMPGVTTEPSDSATSSLPSDPRATS